MQGLVGYKFHRRFDEVAMHENLRRRLVDVVAARMRFNVSRSALETRGHIIAKAARDTLGMTQRQLAKQLGIDHTYLCRIENAHAPLTVDLAEKLLVVVDEAAAEKAG